jgi:hypothetical protein
MKKIFLILALSMGVAICVQAQGEGKAIGVRFGWGGELSYQHPLQGSNRLEFDLGLYGFDKYSTSIYLTAVYQKVFDLSSLSQGFNWYVGAGPQLGYYGVKATKVDGVRVKGTHDLALGAVGQIGIEYNFAKVPLQISLDWRPGILILPDFGFGYESGGLGIRYRF